MCQSGRLDIEPRAPPVVLGGVDLGLRVRSLGADAVRRAVIPLPGFERGAQAGIEPATAALVTQQIGSAGAGQIMSTQLHSRMCRPSGRLPGRQNLSLATGEGDVRIK